MPNIKGRGVRPARPPDRSALARRASAGDRPRRRRRVGSMTGVHVGVLGVGLGAGCCLTFCLDLVRRSTSSISHRRGRRARGRTTTRGRGHGARRRPRSGTPPCTSSPRSTCASHAGLKAIRSRTRSRMPRGADEEPERDQRRDAPAAAGSRGAPARTPGSCAGAASRRPPAARRARPRPPSRTRASPQSRSAAASRCVSVRRERATSDFAVSGATSSASPISSSERPSSALSAQRGPLALGQLGERRDDAAELVRLDRARLGLLRRRRPATPASSGSASRSRRVEVQRAPPRDRRQPRAHVGRPRPADQRAVRGEQRLLHGVLGELGREAPRDVAQQRLAVALDELGERALVARARARGEPSIVLDAVSIHAADAGFRGRCRIF